ncbi:hypothetical protein TgHK011_007927 [Trichoderma gracile]|nr:hypothetical protein TgHK011_007927 [Trichoderma gracile]
MFSVRALTRAAPRTIGRAAGASLRSSAIARPSLTRTPAVKALLPTRAAAAFSTTVRRSKEEDVEVDEALSAKLESEIQIEEDIKANEQQPASIKDFLDNSPFELVDTPGQEVVKLIRNYGDEKITISFSIADITNFDPYADENLFDEDDLPEESSTEKQQQQQNHDDGLEGDEEGLDEDAGAPINLSILIEKPGKTAGALNIDATARDGDIVVDNMFFYEDATVARIDNPEAAQKRADVYPGPPFGSLDEDLQVLMERFLEERGINETLAAFVPDYVDVKEQQEYLRWLKNVRTFVDA